MKDNRHKCSQGKTIASIECKSISDQLACQAVTAAILTFCILLKLFIIMDDWSNI